MRYYRMTDVDGEQVIGAEVEPGRIAVLTASSPTITDIRDLVFAARVTGMRIDDIALKVKLVQPSGGETSTHRGL